MQVYLIERGHSVVKINRQRAKTAPRVPASTSVENAPGKTERQKTPVNIRRNVDSYVDPYLDDESLCENTRCTRCGAIYLTGRWYLKEQVPTDQISGVGVHETLCPACRKQRDRAPGGIVRLSGDFLTAHREEIFNLIHNESDKAQVVNPLERIMDIQSEADATVITTTNEKLAQRIGRALFKAYSGKVEYQFGEDTKAARVNWHRDD